MIPVLRCKSGCQFKLIGPGGFRILAALDQATKILGHDLTLTAGTNDHVVGRHVTGEAFDISVKDLTVPMVIKLTKFLVQTLGDRFTVLYECPRQPTEPDLQLIAWINPEATAEHLHIQTRKGTVYPPEEQVLHV